MSLLRGLLIVPPVVAGAALLWFAVAGREPPKRDLPPETVTPVRVITATPRRFVPRVSGFGTVEPARTWNAIAQVSGRVVEVAPQFVRGGFVAKDDVLVRLAAEDYELEIAQSRANIESAEADIEELALSRETTGLTLKIERQALEISEKDLARKQDLVARGTTSQAIVDEERAAVLAQQAKVQELENKVALVPAQLKALQQAKAVAEAKLKIAELNLERTVIRAPFDGRVAAADVEVSQFVGTGTTMGALDGVAAAEIEVQIAPAQMAGFVGLAFAGMGEKDGPLAKLGAGLGLMSAVVEIGFVEWRPQWKAEVKRVSDAFDPETRSIGIIVSVPEPYGTIMPGRRPPLVKGIFAEVELRGPPVEGVVLVPRSAVEGGRVRIAGPDDRLRFAPVEVGYAFRDVAVVTGGIEPGTRIVVSDLSPAIENMLLSPTPDAAAEARLAAAAEPDDTPEKRAEGAKGATLQ